MYPSPSPAYRPQMPQQPPQLIPQTTNQNVRPTPPPPPPSVSTASSTYPYLPYNYNSNSVASGHPGQPPLLPQPMPYAMGGNTASSANQQNNNLNGPPSVSRNIS